MQRCWSGALGDISKDHSEWHSPDCKSAGIAFGGSNPPRPTTLFGGTTAIGRSPAPALDDLGGYLTQFAVLVLGRLHENLERPVGCASLCGHQDSFCLFDYRSGFHRVLELDGDLVAVSETRDVGSRQT